MEKYEIVFVVLTYINSEDLTDFFYSLKSLKFSNKTIVVDAFHDQKSSNDIKKVAEINNADYVCIENRGYSYGNNYGIEYARKHYEYNYIVISNPDIEIKSFEINDIEAMRVGCYGPHIITKDGRFQNPMYYFKNGFSRKLVYLGMKRNRKAFMYLGIALNKLSTALVRLSKKKHVYQLHGSFIVFHRDVIERTIPIFDESMFLFAEESYLAYKLQKMRIPSYYVEDIKVFHKEDGSMKFLKDINTHLKESNIYVYEKYYKSRGIIDGK